jgi:hypothetical protein
MTCIFEKSNLNFSPQIVKFIIDCPSVLKSAIDYPSDSPETIDCLRNLSAQVKQSDGKILQDRTGKRSLINLTLIYTIRFLKDLAVL